MIRIESITFKYDDKVVINNISLSLKKEHIYGLIGTNGIGKSTLLNCLTTNKDVNSGIIFYDNKNIINNEDYLKELFFLDDNFNYSLFTIKRLIKYYKTNKGLDFDKSKFYRLQSIFNIDEDKLFQRMSLGIKKLAVLIVVLSFNPKILILDEYLEGLDIVNKNKIKDIILENNTKDNIIIITSHKTSDLSNICDDLILIKDSSNIIMTNIDELKEKYILVQLILNEEYDKEYFIDLGFKIKSFKRFENIHWIGLDNDNYEIEQIKNIEYIDYRILDSSLEEVIFNEFTN